MLAVFSLNYGAEKIFDELSEEDKQAFQNEYGETTRHSIHGDFVGDPALALKIFKRIELRRIIENEQINRMDKILARLEHLSQNIEKMQTFNEKCDVHVGGYALLQVNDTTLLEDACTDKLQEQLNAGWRILAVCVQPDGRRPDYILGRYNAGKDGTK